MNVVFAVLFLVLEVGVLFTFLRAGIYDWFDLVLLLLIVLNIVKLRSMFASKKNAEPNKYAKPEANAVPGDSATHAVAAAIDTPAVPREVLTDLTGGEEETMDLPMCPYCGGDRSDGRM